MIQKNKPFLITFSFCVKLSYMALLIIFVFILSSCGTSKKTSKQDGRYPGTIHLTNGKKTSGIIHIPSGSSKTVVIVNKENNKDVHAAFNSEETQKIEVYHPNSPDHPSTMQYMPIKDLFNKISYRWLVVISEGPYASAYIGADFYKITPNGEIELGGYRQVIYRPNGSVILNPSFPIYLMKKGDRGLTTVSLKEGISFEESSFRSGVSRFFADDPKLSEYMRHQKWKFDDLNIIIKNYNPNRGNGDLTINGITIAPLKKSLLTRDFDKELFWTLETAIPSDEHYGSQYALGIRSTLFRFMSYGVNAGFGSVEYIDDVKRVENHPGNWIEAPAIESDFSKQNSFRINTFAGAQLSFDLGKIYLVPAAHISFGGLMGVEYQALNYGPMATLDIGFKLKKGGILLLGGGYNYNIPLKSEEDKETASAPGFKAYEPYSSLLFRISYKH